MSDPAGLPAPGQVGAGSGPELPTRKRMPLWDRIKFLLLLTLLFWFFVWSELSNPNPFNSFGDALQETVDSKWMLFALFGLELVRQLHYLLAERFARYYRFWTESVFGRWERRVGRLDDWNRYRVARATKVLIFLAVASIVIGTIYDVPPTVAFFELPSRVWSWLPMVFQLLFAMVFLIGQFGALFWFLSRGGVDTYMPEEIKTRFTDVWGQDAVLDKVKENMVFLERPEAIEEKGGFVPGGVLLWGPPGTGKTLMAEAVAGETGKPFVFVDPGAFAQPLTARVLTPTGWRKMGELAVGEHVFGRDGLPHRVLGVYPQGERPILRVTFSDGASTRVTPDHLWAVQSRWQRERTSSGRWQIRATSELGELRSGHKRGWRWSVPLMEPAQLEPTEDLPLDPYVLGALLGDGCFTAGSIILVNTDPALIRRVSERLPTGVSVTGEGPRFRLVGVGHSGRSILRDLLIGLGLDRCLAPDKFVPDMYLGASASDRLELLRGLLDTDGSVARTASGRTWTGFGTASPRLRDGVVDLVRSLGGITTTTTLSTPGGRPFWQLHIRVPDTINPFAVKADRVRPRSRPVHRFIANIESDGYEEAQCILVDAPDHLYVTDDYVVTHNTNMFMGVGILKVKGLFRKLRKLALRYGGVIVFFDEADSLGNRGALTPGPFGGPQQALPAEMKPDFGEHTRWLSVETQAALFQVRPRVVDGVIMGGMAGGGGGMGTLQALLSELSGLKKPRGFLNRIVRRALGMQPKPPPKYRIMVMMASNMPQALDEALLRPGRIDRIYKVGYPAKEGRKRTYEGYLAKIRHELTDEDVEKLATITPYATGASIKDLVNEALINAIRSDRDAVRWIDVIHAKHLKELGPPEDVEYIQRERHAIAIHEACHAVAAYRTRRHLTIDLATIEKGGTYLGMVSSIKPEDQFTRWRSEYEADIVVSLASLAGERLFFEGDSSSGVSGDLESATTIAVLMEGHWGMGKTVTSHAVTHKVGIAGGGRPGGGEEERKDLLEGSLGERIETDLVELLARAKALLTEHRADVLRLTHALESHKTLSGDDVVAVFEGTEGPLIDGRDYHDPVFTAALEGYHQIVVDAHKVHEKVEIALPRLDGDAPDDGEVAAATIS